MSESGISKASIKKENNLKSEQKRENNTERAYSAFAAGLSIFLAILVLGVSMLIANTNANCEQARKEHKDPVAAERACHDFKSSSSVSSKILTFTGAFIFGLGLMICLLVKK